MCCSKYSPKHLMTLEKNKSIKSLFRSLTILSFVVVMYNGPSIYLKTFLFQIEIDKREKI